MYISKVECFHRIEQVLREAISRKEMKGLAVVPLLWLSMSIAQTTLMFFCTSEPASAPPITITAIRGSNGGKSQPTA